MEPVIRTRVTLLALAFAAAALGIGVRLHDLQVRQAADLQAQARRQHEQRVEIEGRRGEIVDRNGRELALSLETWSLHAHPWKVKEPARAARLLALALGQPYTTVLEKLRSDSPFVWIARRLDPSVAAAVKALDLPVGPGQAFDFDLESKRFYPQGHLGVHVVGFANIDQIGVEGIERVFDDKLRGDSALYLAVRDGRGGALLQPVRPASRQAEDVVLTLDLALQHIVERELDRALRETRSKAAAALVLDPATGEILALANRPTVDPNEYGKSSPESRRNRAVVDLYEPGSTFKVVTGAAMLDSGAVAPTEMFHCENGTYAFASRKIRDHHAYGLLTFRGIIENSSNIGMVKIGTRMAHSTLHEYIDRFGIGERTGIELPGEAAGLVAPAARWTPSTRASICFGHEIAITPLQMAVALGAIANDGVLVPPRIVMGTRDALGELHPAPSREPHRVVSSRTAATMVDLLAGVIEKGTGKQAAVPGYRLAGKTGTAQKVIQGRGYSSTEFMSSFGGFGPVRGPRLLCFVVLDTPAGGIHTGGLSAAPVFSRIMAEGLAYLRVPPDDDVLLERKQRLEEERAKRRVEQLAKARRASPAKARGAAEDEALAGPIATGLGEVPDVRGMSLRDAVAKLVSRRLRVAANGTGFVVEQSLAPASAVTEGQVCTLRLEAKPPLLVAGVRRGDL